MGDVESKQVVEVEVDAKLPTTSRKWKRRDTFDSENGDLEMIHTHLEARMVYDAKRIRMDWILTS